MRNHLVPVLCVIVAAAVLLAGGRINAKPLPSPATPPDLTQNAGVDRTLTYNLGATGLRGWIYTKPANFFESQQGRTTAASRQILVTHVGAKSPADTMFSNDIRMAGLKVLAKYHFREGLRAGLKFAQTQGAHGSQKRMGEIMKELLRYGTAAKEVLPELRQLVVQCRAEKNFPDWAKKEKTAAVEEGIRAIEATTTQPELRSMPAATTGG